MLVKTRLSMQNYSLLEVSRYGAQGFVHEMTDIMYQAVVMASVLVPRTFHTYKYNLAPALKLILHIAEN